MADSNLEDLVQASRDNYLQTLEQLVQQKLPGVINPRAAGCAVGEVCHGGTFKNIKDQVINPANPAAKG